MIITLMINRIGPVVSADFFTRSFLSWLLLVILVLICSFSFTRFVYIIVAYFLGVTRYISLFGLMLLLLLQYLMLCYWLPIMVGVRIYIVDLILAPDASMPMWSRAEALYTVVLQHLDLIYGFWCIVGLFSLYLEVFVHHLQ
jgi:hypothetical protein